MIILNDFDEGLQFTVRFLQLADVLLQIIDITFLFSEILTEHLIQLHQSLHLADHLLPTSGWDCYARCQAH